MASSISPEANSDGIKDNSRCTVGKVKTLVKSVFAQLCSHLGLCLMVIGYCAMGAVIFVALEKGHEMETRKNVSNLKIETLNELYNLTGKTKVA